jgi:signal transduction histidine kinase
MTASSLRILSSDSKENQRQPNRPPPLESESGIVSSLAHEINNPVEALHQLHYLIETEGTLKEKGRQYLALAREEVRRISQILHAAMEMRDTGDPEDTDLPGLLRSVLDFYKSRLKAQGISVNTRYRTAAHLSGYPHQLRQMCANLLLNAVDATPSGGKIYARIAPAQARSQTRIASHVCGYRQRHCRKKPGANLRPILYHKRTCRQWHRTFIGQDHGGEASWRAARPQQHQSGP